MREIIKKYLGYIIIFLIFVAVVIAIFYNNQKDVEEEIFEPEVKEEMEVEDLKPKKIKVDIKGEVINPGVYELEENTRVIDAINISGGLTENADTTLINLSKTLTNEMVIIIYNKEKIEQIKEQSKEIKVVYEYIEKECSCPDPINKACINDYKAPEDKTENKDTKVNINTASLEELQTIPGIGESKAKAIIEYRNKTPFEKIEDITNISGIGNSTFEKLKNYITV